MFGLNSAQLKQLEHTREVIIEMSDTPEIPVKCVHSKYGQYYCLVSGFINKFVLFYDSGKYLLRFDIVDTVYKFNVGAADRLLLELGSVSSWVDSITLISQLTEMNYALTAI